MENLEQFNICLTSAKKATGILKIFTILEKTKNELQSMKLKYMPKVYVMGATNSGKSALLQEDLKISLQENLDMNSILMAQTVHSLIFLSLPYRLIRWTKPSKL